MKQQLSLRLATLALALGVLGVPVAFAATPMVSGNQLEFRPDAPAPAYQLRVVAPNGAIHEDLFMAGERIELSLQQLPGGGMDGQYTYEITPILGVQQRGERLAGGGTRASAPTESGFLRVVDGRLYTSTDGPESSSGLALVRMQALDVSMSADQVIPDDLIVQGSLCTGFDCVNNESFGFDTIRMKENNTRIKFEDTSSTTGFPTTDWLLTANDSASGGADKFSIEDVTSATVPFTVLGGAPTNSLVVDSQGDLGVRTAAPILDLHMVTGDTPAIRMEQTNASGYTAQTWDIGANEANFFVRDVTGGSRLSFRIRPGAPTSSIDIAADGDVGIGTSAPEANLDISRSGDVTMRLSNTSGAMADWELRNNEATGRLTISDDPARVRVPIKIAPNAVDNLLRVGILDTSTVDINGDLFVTGTITPDYVFEQDFALPTIKEHAEAMWANRHLPKVAPAEANGEGRGVINVGARSQGMLEELEYAHIYIEQLHDELVALRAEVEALKAARSAE